MFDKYTESKGVDQVIFFRKIVGHVWLRCNGFPNKYFVFDFCACWVSSRVVAAYRDGWFCGFMSTFVCGDCVV